MIDVDKTTFEEEVLKAEGYVQILMGTNSNSHR